VHGRFWQLVVSLAIVSVALVAGLAAAGVIDPSLTPVASDGQTGSATQQPASTRPETAHPSPSPSAMPDDVAVLIGAGDIADCSRSEDELTADLVESMPGSVFTLGDNANPDGTRDAFEECYGPTWGRPAIMERTRPAPGDEDYDTQDARPYFDYFGAAAGELGAGYYAYDAGDWRIYVLNSNCGSIDGCGEGSPQAEWLRADLAAEPRRCVLAMWHHPYFTSGPSGGRDSRERSLWRILHAAGAELVLSGHDHHYERFAPQSGSGEVDPTGLVQFIVGTGGSRPDAIVRNAAHSEARVTEVHGVLRLELAPRGYSFRFISVAGRDFSDSGSGSCH
jgi:alkaline phosphatase